MSVRSVLSAVALSCIVGVAVVAQAVPEVKLVPSPAGDAAIQLGGRWEKTEQGGQAPRFKDFLALGGARFVVELPARPP